MSESQRHARRRVWIVAITALGVAIVQLVILVLLHRGINLRFRLGLHALVFLKSFLPPVLGGFVLHALVYAVRGRGVEFFKGIIRPTQLLLLSLLLAILTMQATFYSLLKLTVPLLTDRNFDAWLWEIDSWLLFGLSPNVFFVNLLNQSLLLRFIDFGYGYFFFFTVVASFPLFLPLQNDRFRVSFIVANLILWSAGAWLYFAIPSLGPAYRFHEVWDVVRDQFPVSTYWQKRLIDNYELVLKIPHGTIDSRLRIHQGIGAFPSLHVGFQTLFVLYLGTLHRTAGRAAWLLVLLTFLGSILTGWHYMIDSLAGLGLAAGTYFLMERVILPPPPEAGAGETGS